MGEGPTLPEGAILSPPPCPLRKSREPGALRLMGGTTEAHWLPARAPPTPPTLSLGQDLTPLMEDE